MSDLENTAQEFIDLIHSRDGKKLWQMVSGILKVQAAYMQTRSVDIEDPAYELKNAKRDGMIDGLEWLLDQASQFARIVERKVEEEARKKAAAAADD